MLSKLSNEDVGACGRVTDLRQRVEIDEMQCDFMLGCGTTDAIFIVHQLQEKHLIANKPLYMAFVYLEKKAFDCVHQDFIWLAMPTLGTDEWLVHLVQSMYKDVRSHANMIKASSATCPSPSHQP